jgi:hypothetical protein
MSLNFFSHSLENTLLFSLVIAVVHVALVVAAPEPSVELGFAANYVILAKTGISTIPGPNSIITGDIAVSPITGAAMTGFAFTKDSSGELSTDTGQISGNAYAADFAATTPSKLTSAVSPMEGGVHKRRGSSKPHWLKKKSGWWPPWWCATWWPKRSADARRLHLWHQHHHQWQPPL